MIIIVTEGDDRIIEQIMKQLNKVIEVLKVVDLNETHFLDRETALIKVHKRLEHRDEAIRIADIFRAKIVDSSPTTYTIEITGDVDKVEALINLLRPLGIKELILDRPDCHCPRDHPHGVAAARARVAESVTLARRIGRLLQARFCCNGGSAAGCARFSYKTAEKAYFVSSDELLG